MANNSVEHPEGLLTPETLKSFFSYTGSGSSLTYTYGHERIPNNWVSRASGGAGEWCRYAANTSLSQYKRALTNPWTMPDILTGVAQQCLAYREFLPLLERKPVACVCVVSGFETNAHLTFLYHRSKHLRNWR